MNNTSRIIISSVLVVCVLLSTSAFAAIYHTSAASAESKSIYVAGNPNLYPVEYYDEESGCYMGIMPVILEEISKEIGYDFTYIESGKEDKRFVEHFGQTDGRISTYYCRKGWNESNPDKHNCDYFRDHPCVYFAICICGIQIP